MVRACHQLLDHREVDTALRVGDCYALLVEVSQRTFELGRGPELGLGRSSSR